MFCLSVKCEREIRVRKGERERETGRETKATFSLCKLLSRFSLSLSLSLFVYMEMRSLLMALSRLELIIELVLLFNDILTLKY